MPNIPNTFFFGLAEEFRMQISTSLLADFVFYHPNRMRLGVSILANASHHPRHFHAGLAARDFEAVVANLLRDVDRREATDAS